MKTKVTMKPKMPKKKIDGMVYCSYRDGEVIIARRYVYPKLSEQNSSFASRNANLFRIAPSDGYKRDLRSYIDAHNSSPDGEENPLRSWNNLYIKLMSALARNNPSVDLRSLTKEEIYAQKLPCICVKSAVEAGLLPSVSGWKKLTNQI